MSDTTATVKSGKNWKKSRNEGNSLTPSHWVMFDGQNQLKAEIKKCNFFFAFLGRLTSFCPKTSLNITNSCFLLNQCPFSNENYVFCMFLKHDLQHYLKKIKLNIALCFSPIKIKLCSYWAWNAL